VTLGSHQTAIGKSQDHFTPRWLLDRLGPLDLDPAAGDPRPWDVARINWSSGSLERDWPRELFVFLNPPFDRREVGKWIVKLAAHGGGIALLHARLEAAWFTPCWQSASGILFLADRIFFHRVDGSRHPFNSGAPACLVAFGTEALARLRRCGIPGVFIVEWTIMDVAAAAQGNGNEQARTRSVELVRG
jgi:hypothetical protein